MIDQAVAAAARLRAALSHLQAPVVGTAADYAAAMQCPPAMPAVYVGPLDENAGRTQAYGTLQVHSGQIAVLFMVTAASADAGRADGLEVVQVLRAAVRASLLGWRFDETHEPAEFTSGRLLDASDAQVSWQDNYRIAYHPPSGEEEPVP